MVFVQTPCAIACISICVHVTNLKHCQSYTIVWTYENTVHTTLVGMGSASLAAAVAFPRSGDQNFLQGIKLVSWCFTPSQPVRLYQGEQGIKEIYKKTKSTTTKQACPSTTPAHTGNKAAIESRYSLVLLIGGKWPEETASSKMAFDTRPACYGQFKDKRTRQNEAETTPTSGA